MIFSIIKRLVRKQRAEPLVSLTDEDLMIQYGRGEVQAFEELMKRHQKSVFGFIFRFVGNREKAEDLLQEVFLRVIKSAANYRMKAKFTTWLYTIARNICIDEARKRAKRTEVSLNRNISKDQGDGGKTFLDNVEDQRSDDGSSFTMRKEFRKKLEQALSELPSEQREVFLMREFSGLKFREIASVVGVPENTVKSRMRYALDALRGHLEEFRGVHLDREQATS